MGRGGEIRAGLSSQGDAVASERPEEPAKYIHELPKLPPPEITTSAVVCGNWVAQVRQILVGLSPTASTWWATVEQSAGVQYQRWLVADPIDRLLLDPSTVVAPFDGFRYQRVESRAVTLMLSCLPTQIKDEAVSNRWLSTASLLFRIHCIYQPGGSWERSMLLSQLVNPESVKTFTSAVAMLRKWQQSFYRVKELHAALPDSSLLLKGIDGSVASLLLQNPRLGFRVNAFRNRVSLDYNPTVSTVLQFVRLLQAEFEGASLSQEPGSTPDKRARVAVAAEASMSQKGAFPKASGFDEVLGSHVQAKAIGGISDGKGKGKGKDKGKDLGKEVGVCHAFSEKKGCKYGDKCRFSHDRATARKQGRCLACGQEGHYRPDCPIVAPENRQVQDPTSPRSSGPPPKSVPPVPTGPPNPKTKATPQAKRVIEECGSGTSTSAQAQEALMAEAAKILKDVTLKPLRVEGDSLGALGLNQGWVMSAIATASDPQFALVDSGATNALRPAREEELKEARVIKVDLASGVTELHINRHGTLLSSVPCQVIIPAGYLVRLGFSIAWKKRGCVIKRRGRARLEVKVVKGCPLIPREEGLQLLYEYEGLLETGSLPVLKLMSSERTPSFTAENSRQWLADKVAGGCLTRQDQLDWLSVMFPEAPSRVRHRAAGLDVGNASWSFEGVPWNRRVRRSVLKAKPGEVLLHLFSGQQRWKGPGRIIEVEKSKGADLLDEGVFQHLLGWSLRGVVGAVVGGPPCRTVSPCRAEGDGGPPPVRGRLQGRWGLEGLSGSHAELVESDSVLWLRFILAYVVAQAAADSVDSVRREAPALEVPGDICDPLELAKWALRQAAARRREPPSVESRTKRVVMLVWEHPADPEFYMGSGRRPEWGWPSWWVFPEWQQIAQLYGVLQARFDQGKFQHERPKPTQVATTSWFLYESLDQQFLTREERALFGVGPQTTSVLGKMGSGAHFSCFGSVV